MRTSCFPWDEEEEEEEERFHDCCNVLLILPPSVKQDFFGVYNIYIVKEIVVCEGKEVGTLVSVSPRRLCILRSDIICLLIAKPAVILAELCRWQGYIIGGEVEWRRRRRSDCIIEDGGPDGILIAFFEAKKQAARQHTYT